MNLTSIDPFYTTAGDKPIFLPGADIDTIGAMALPHLVYLRRHAIGLVDARSLAAAAGIGRADAERIIRSKVPQALGMFKSRDGARRIVDKLHAAGLECFHITQEDLAHFRPSLLEYATRDGDEFAWEGTAW